MHQRFTRIAEELANLSYWQLIAILWISSLAMCLFLLGSDRTTLTGTMNIVENWGAVERLALWQDFLEPVVPRFTLPTWAIAWGFRTAMLASFIAQVGAFLGVMQSRNPSMKRWMIGPFGAHIIMALLMVPSNSDVFFYQAIGDFAANGLNPYIHELMDQPDHPLIPYNYWIDINVPYGPHWVNYNRILMGIVGPDPIVATLAHKILAGLVAFALVGFVYWFAKRLSRSQTLAVAAAVLVAWQPNMILETSGQVHNDPHTMLIATAGLAVAILGGLSGVRAGILLVAFSAVVKFITLPLLGVIGIIRIIERRKPNGIQRILGQWLLDGLGILAVIIAAFLPYWEGIETLNEMRDEPNKLYTQPIWRAIQSVIRIFVSQEAADTWSNISRTALQITLLAILLGVLIWLGKKLWNGPESHTSPGNDLLNDDGLPWWTRYVLYASMLMLLALAYVPVNSHPWYWIWPVVMVALVIAYDTRNNSLNWSISLLPSWFWIYVWGNAVLTLVYHTRIAHF